MNESSRSGMDRNTQFMNFFKAVGIERAQPQGQRAPSLSALMRASANAAIVQRSFDERSKVAYIGAIMIPEIIYAMKMVPFCVEMITVFLSHSKSAPDFLNCAQENHYASDICTISRCALGAALKDCMPRPDAVLFTSYPCDSSSKLFKILSDRYKTEYFMLDVPYHHNDESVSYLADQIKEMVSFLSRITGAGLDIDALRESIGYSNIAVEYLIKISGLCKNIPSPLSFMEAMDIETSNALFGSKEMADICKVLFEEVEKNARSVTDKHTRKPRLLWQGLRPFFANELIEYLENVCNVDIIFQNSNNVLHSIIMDPADPFRSLAKKLITISTSGPVDERLKVEELRARELIDEYHIDGIISFIQWGCRHMSSIYQIIRESLARLDVPLLEIDGDYIDERNFSFAQVKTRVAAFTELLQARLK